jgi:hypothetical protein
MGKQGKSAIEKLKKSNKNKRHQNRMVREGQENTK